MSKFSKGRMHFFPLILHVSVHLFTLLIIYFSTLAFTPLEATLRETEGDKKKLAPTTDIDICA